MKKIRIFNAHGANRVTRKICIARFLHRCKSFYHVDQHKRKNREYVERTIYFCKLIDKIIRGNIGKLFFYLFSIFELVQFVINYVISNNFFI